jgi:hypothetical protein
MSTPPGSEPPYRRASPDRRRSGAHGLAATRPAGFFESVTGSGLTAPTAMEFAPDSRIFVSERHTPRHQERDTAGHAVGGRARTEYVR